MSRLGEYLAVKPALAVGTAVVGAAAVFATAVLQAPAPGDDQVLAAPPVGDGRSADRTPMVHSGTRRVRATDGTARTGHCRRNARGLGAPMS